MSEAEKFDSSFSCKSSLCTSFNIQRSFNNDNHNIFRMEETLEVEGRYYLEEVSLTDTASSKGTISPLPIQIKPPGEYAPDGMSVLFSIYDVFTFFLDLEHIQRLVDEKQLDEKLKEFRTHESEEKIKLEDFGPMPEMIDDFIRNYFRNMGLNKTLATVILLLIIWKVILYL